MANPNETKRPKSKILVDGGDPEDTKRIQQLIGFVDGQTTNPSLIAKNPDVKRIVASGQRLSEEQERAEYRKIVSAISPLVGDAGVSIEVFADVDSKAEELLKQGREMNSWIPNAYIKYPCTTEGLKAAKRSVAKGIHVNITLCFSQQQAAAVYAATKGSKAPVYVSPFWWGGWTILARTGSTWLGTSSACTPRATDTFMCWRPASATYNTCCIRSMLARSW